MTSSIHSISRLVRLLKLMRVAVQFLFVWYLPFILQELNSYRTDPFNCKALAKNGHWLQTSIPVISERKSQTWEPQGTWQPHGCMLQSYDTSRITQCLDSKKIVLAGDSTIRAIYWAIARKLYPDVKTDIMQKHADMELTVNGVDLEFIWDPYLNSTKLEIILASLDRTRLPANSSLDLSPPAILLAGTGLWQARHQADPLQSFQLDIADLASVAVKYATPTSGYGINDSQPIVAIAPVLEPHYASLDKVRGTTITPKKVNLMNGYLGSLSEANILWSYNALTANTIEAYQTDGIHLEIAAVNQKADTLLNLRCNGFLASKGKFPFTGTCCSNYYVANLGEKLLAASLAMPWMILVCTLGIFKVIPTCKERTARRKFVSAVALCYLCDRTQILSKENKLFKFSDFVAMSTSAAVIGLLTIQSSTPRIKPSKSSGLSDIYKQTSFLSLDQTDEWKGWMQAVILIYHYTGASKVLWIYQLVRLMVASYLFLTGFGHTVFFCQRRDYSLHRVASVLVRLNLLSGVLAYAMRTNYIFYYFAPLSSLWFVVIYLTMRLQQDRNTSHAFVITKISCSAIIMTALVRTPGVLEQIFRVLELTCNIHWDLKEWRFRVLLDLYVVYVGALSGLLYLRFQSGSECFTYSLPTFLRTSAFNLLLACLSIATITVYIILAFGAPSKPVYNSYHTYLAPLPVLAFVFLRNSHSALRARYSAAFARLGRCSLETFTLQFHMWLAADTKGLLRTGLFGREGVLGRFTESGRLEDFLLLTPLFLWMSENVAKATGLLTRWIVDGAMEWEQSAGDQTVTEKADKEREDVRAEEEGEQRLRESRFAGKEGLKARICVILLMMWIFNWVSLVA